MNATRAIALVVLIGNAQAVAAQSSPASRLAEQLDRDVPRLIEAAGVPGISAAVVLDGRIAWSGAFGVADAATGSPVTAGTVFQAASLTKQVFAYTVLRLVDRGILDLDTPLVEYLRYPRLEGEEGYEQITARHALSHSTGLPNWGGERLELGFAPGEGFQYSGEGYVYLQRTIEHLTGETLDVLVDREVVGPFGLQNSWMFWRASFEDRVAAGHDDWGTPRAVQRGEEANAAWSFLTTADDYARIAVAIMNGEGLRPETLDQALEPQVRVADRSQLETSDRLYWGLGWGLQFGSAGRGLWQWGHNGGFRAYLLAFPDRRDAVVYFTNSDAGLSIARDLVSTVGTAAGWGDDEHWALTWLDYEPHDSERRVARRRLVAAFRDQGVEAGLELYETLREEQPDIINDPFSASVGRALAGLGLTDRGLALLRRNVELHPRGGNSLSVLADLELEAGLYRDALATYRRVLAVRPGHEMAARGIEWIEPVVAALDAPITPGDLERLVGQYGPRRITLEDGAIYYQRDEGPRRRLRAMGGDTFFLEGLGSFRIRFEEGDGRPVGKIVGLYLDGSLDDESLRTP